jgi:hypothetical protein
MEIRPVGAELTHADRQMNMRKLTSALRQMRLKKCAIRAFSNSQLLSERTEEKPSTDFLYSLFAVFSVA